MISGRMPSVMAKGLLSPGCNVPRAQEYSPPACTHSGYAFSGDGGDGRMPVQGTTCTPNAVLVPRLLICAETVIVPPRSALAGEMRPVTARSTSSSLSDGNDETTEDAFDDDRELGGHCTDVTIVSLALLFVLGSGIGIRLLYPRTRTRVWNVPPHPGRPPPSTMEIMRDVPAAMEGIVQ